MNDPSASPQDFDCPHCGKRLRVAASSAGKRTRCPSCSRSIVVPQAKNLQEDADSWLQLDGVADSKPVAKSPAGPPKQEARPKPAKAPKPETPSKSFKPQNADGPKQSPRSPDSDSGPKLGKSLFDDDLPELKPLDPELSPIPSPLLSEMNLLLDEETSQPTKRTPSDVQTPPNKQKAESAKRPVDEEFSFPCKVCGTLLYSPASRAGTMTRCPDCHSELKIPSPPVKKKPVEFKIDPEVANVRLAPVESSNPRIPTSESLKTKEILERAAKEAALERKEIEAVAAPFDSQRWLSLIFGFLRDPGVIFLAAILGVCAAACFYALHAIGSLDLPVIQIVIIRLVVCLCFGIPLVVSVLMCFMVILPMAANRKLRVEEWPFGRFGEAIGELFMLATAMAIAAMPGGFLASVMSWTGLPSIVSEVLILLSIWAFTPLILLGMIENNAVAQPFAPVIFRSFSHRPDAWGAMYFQSGMAVGALFMLYSIGYMTNPLITAVFGLFFPVGLFFIANQYGVLAGRISDITNLGFEGDFSQDLLD